MDDYWTRLEAAGVFREFDRARIYMITFSTGETKEAIPLLFDGAKRSGVSRHGLTVSLSSE